MAFKDKAGRWHADNGKYIKDSAVAQTVKELKQGQNYVADFMDYESRNMQPYHFGDTRPQFTYLDAKNYTLLDNWYHKNGVANQVVNKPAKDAVRNGWRIVIPKYPDLQSQYQEAQDKLSLKPVFAKELSYRRLHGDGYITFGIQELNATSLDTPVNPLNVENLTFVHAFGQKYVQRILINNDPTDVNYNQEQSLILNPTSTGEKINPDGSTIPNPPKTKPTVIDASRYCHTSEDKLEDDETGNSVLTLNADPIKVLDTALYSAGKILFEYTQYLLNSDHLSKEDNDKYLHDMRILSQGFANNSVVTMGTDEKLTRINASVGGIDSLFNFAWQILNTGTGIPKSVLLGEQSGTLAGASQDVANYYDMVKSLQEDVIKPQLTKIIRLLMYSTDVAGGYLDPDSIDWHIEFNPLFTPDEKTQSETMVNIANAVNTLLAAGIIDQDQGALIWNGLANTQIAGIQNNIQQDSADKPPTKEQIKQYKEELKAINHGRKT